MRKISIIILCLAMLTACAAHTKARSHKSNIGGKIDEME